MWAEMGNSQSTLPGLIEDMCGGPERLIDLIVNHDSWMCRQQLSCQLVTYFLKKYHQKSDYASQLGAKYNVLTVTSQSIGT